MFMPMVSHMFNFIFLDTMKEGKSLNEVKSLKDQSIHENSKRLSLISEKTEDGAESPHANAQLSAFGDISNDSQEERVVSPMQIIDEVIEDLEVLFPLLGFEVIEETNTEIFLMKRSNNSQYTVSKTLFSDFNQVNPDADLNSENDYSIVVKDDNKNTKDIIPSFPKNISSSPNTHISLKSEGRFKKFNI